MQAVRWMSVALCFLGCATTGQEEFRAKIPTYCETSEACAPLATEARRRRRDCEAASAPSRCDQERADEARIAALRLEAMVLERRAREVAERTQLEVDNEDARRRLLADIEHNTMVMESAERPLRTRDVVAQCEATRTLRCEATQALNQRRQWVWLNCKGGNSVAVSRQSRAHGGMPPIVIHEDWRCPPGTPAEYLATIPVMDISTAVERETLRCSTLLPQERRGACDPLPSKPIAPRLAAGTEWP
jgi:hypothetical protein